MSSHAEARAPSFPTRFAQRFIVTYKTRVSPGLGARCRFEPSCSSYALESYERYGFLTATAKTVWRILRCNPLNRGPRIDRP